jgi:hypothetical protein
MAPRRDTPAFGHNEGPPNAYDRQGALIAHQLQELGVGVKTLSTLLQDMRVENAKRDSKDTAHDNEFVRVFSLISALTVKVDAALVEIKNSVTPLTTAHEQGKPVLGLGKEILRWAVAFATAALVHYLWKGR